MKKSQQSIWFKEDRLIISIYDYTGEWAKPYIEAGYPVMLWDGKHEGDIIKNWGRLIADIMNAIEAGYYPYGLLAAPPCDDFAVSGARWFKIKDASTVRCGDNDIASNTVDLHVLLVECVFLLMETIEQLTGHKFQFWVTENPVGRIETLVPRLKPFRKLLFNPCDYGDPYTKKTILWGEFNANLPRNYVEPEFLEYTRKDGRKTRFAPQFGKTGGKSAKTKSIRSKTPAGFARAFFAANQ